MRIKFDVSIPYGLYLIVYWLYPWVVLALRAMLVIHVARYMGVNI